MENNLKEFINSELKSMDKMIADAKKRLEFFENLKAAYELSLKQLETTNVEVVQEKES